MSLAEQYELYENINPKRIHEITHATSREGSVASAKIKHQVLT